MRIPKRRGEVLKQQTPQDNYLTPETIERMKRELVRLVKTERPEAISEVQRLAEMGDFSENVGYQVAKATLRRINNRILILEDKIKQAIPIEAGSIDGVIRIGSTVILEIDGKQKTYQIVGGQETDPSRGRISHSSPLGQLLIGKSIGDTVDLNEKSYLILDVS